MSDNFLGLTPESSQFPTDPFTGDGVTQQFNLKRSPAGNNSVLVYVGGIPQTPGSAYNILGKKILFTEAPPKTAPIIVYHKGERSVSSKPAPNSVGTEELQDNVKTFNTQHIVIDGSASYSLNYPVASSASIIVSADSAAQRPDIDFTVAPTPNTISFVGMEIGVKVMILFLAVKGVINAPAAGTVLHESLQVDLKNTLYRSTCRNKVINGSFDIWQRGESKLYNSLGQSNQYNADRWTLQYNGTTSLTATISKQVFTPGQTDVPGNPDAYLRYNCTIAGVAQGYVALLQPIESVRTFSGKKATVSFWAKASSPFNIDLFLQQFFGAGSPDGLGSASSTVFPLSTSWQKYVVTFDVPSIAGKTIGSGKNDSVSLGFHLPNNSVGTVDIARVQFEEGPVATDFEDRFIGDELLLCLRYFEKTFHPLYPIQSNNGALSCIGTATQCSAASTQQNIWIDFKVPKRVSGSVTLYNPGAVGSQVYNYNRSASCTGTLLQSFSTNGFSLYTTPPAGSAPGDTLMVEWISEAEL